METASRVHEILDEEQEEATDQRCKRPKVEVCCEMCGALPEACLNTPFEVDVRPRLLGIFERIERCVFESDTGGVAPKGLKTNTGSLRQWTGGKVDGGYPPLTGSGLGSATEKRPGCWSTLFRMRKLCAGSVSAAFVGAGALPQERLFGF